MTSGPTAAACKDIIGHFEFEHSVDVAGTATDDVVVTFVADHPEAEQEAWRRLVTWEEQRGTYSKDTDDGRPGTCRLQFAVSSDIDPCGEDFQTRMMRS